MHTAKILGGHILGINQAEDTGYMTAIVVNLKRMMKLAMAPPVWLACRAVH